jgi:predicted CXXCH cytochrome family protein
VLTFLTAGPKLLLRGALIHMARSAASMSVIFLSVLVGMAGGNPLGQDSSERPKKADSSKYVGTEVCQGCHEDQYESFAASAHMHLVKTEKAAEGCEGCHGPGAAHVDGGGDPEKIQRFAGASAETIQQRCTGCHAANLGAAHTKARLTCFTCHSIHHYQQSKFILVTSESQLCQRCHNQDNEQPKGHRR